MSYSFSKVETVFRFQYKYLIISVLTEIIRAEQKEQGDICFVFCSDKYLLALNKKHLQHDYYTDIITFNYNQGNIVSGDIFISVDRVKENAPKFGATFQEELTRVIFHGVLHLCGYNDKTKAQQKVMRQKEDYYLSLWSKMK